VEEVRLVQASGAYLIQSNEYIVSYFDTQPLKVFCDAGRFCRVMPQGFLPLSHVVAGLIYAARISTELLAWNLTLWA